MGRCDEDERRDEPEGDQEEWGLQLDGAEKQSASQDESHEKWREMQWILQLLNTERESYF